MNMKLMLGLQMTQIFISNIFQNEKEVAFFSKASAILTLWLLLQHISTAFRCEWSYVLKWNMQEFFISYNINYKWKKKEKLYNHLICPLS